jgi:DNA-binding NarL/FixJ family response regulator
MTATGSSASDALHVLYIDDDPLAVDAFTALAESHGGLVVRPCEAHRALRFETGDGGNASLVLVDLYLRLGNEDGIDVARRIHDVTGLPAAICTVSEAPGDAARAWEAGIPAYLTKAHLLGCRADMPALLRSIADGAIVYHVDPRDHAQSNPLSAREIQILRRKALGQPHRDIARDLYISARTVDSHLANVRSKLGADSTHHAIAIARDLGLVARAGEEGPPGTTAVPPSRTGIA